jgi:hypothetical protein
LTKRHNKVEASTPIAVKRIEAEAAQITTRAKLAQLLNITYENRPDDLVKPDLTPYYGFDEDCVFWHQNAKDACTPFGDEVYSKRFGAPSGL